MKRGNLEEISAQSSRTLENLRNQLEDIEENGLLGPNEKSELIDLKKALVNLALELFSGKIRSQDEFNEYINLIANRTNKLRNSALLVK